MRGGIMSFVKSIGWLVNATTGRAVLWGLAGILACFPASASAVVVPAYQIVDLGPTPSTSDGAYGVNDLGQVAGYRGVRAYLWENGNFTWLWPGSSQARDVNNSGQVAGSINNGSVRWTDDVPTYLRPGDSRRNFGMAINASGDVAGYYDDGSTDHYRAYLWQDGVLTTLVNPSGRASWATGINSSGHVVGDAANAQGTDRGFLWRGGAMTMMPTLPNYNERSSARDVNDLGQVAAMAERNAYDRAYIWQDGVVTQLPHLSGAASSQPYAINNRGLVVGSSGQQAVLWQSETAYDLNELVAPDSGWTLRYAYDINEAGWIVGTGLYAGTGHAFLLVPEPSTLAMLGMGAVGLLGFAWRKRRQR